MKAKKPLLLAALVVALLALGLILPATVAANEDESTSTVEGNCTINMLPDTLIGFTIDMQQSGSETATGYVLQKIMRTTDPAFANAPTVRKATVFTIDDPFWPAVGLDLKYLDYARFHEAGDSYTWPDDLLMPELIHNDPTAYDLANIADFVVALPTTNIFPPELPFLDPYPHRYVVIDFGEPGRKDLVQIYGWAPIDPMDPFSPWYWRPQLAYGADFYAENPQYEVWDPIPVLIGNFQVEVGN